ncbi:MAG: hypothetical protein QXP70_05760 [Methanomassiliicoccales archaeon]
MQWHCCGIFTATVLPSPDIVLLFAAYLILMGSVLAFAIYESNSGVALQVTALLLGGVFFAFLVARNIIALPSYFVSFVNDFSTPLVTTLVLVLVFLGMGLKLGWDVKSLSGEGWRIAASGIVMGFADIIFAALFFGFLCKFIFGWSFDYGALLGSLMGETSAAMVVPFMNHITTRLQEGGSKSAHINRLAHVLKLESTVNSVALVLFLVIFFNEISIGNLNPTFSSFFATIWSSLLQVIRLHAIVLLIVGAGTPLIVYLSSRFIAFIVKRRLTDKEARKLRVYSVFSLNTLPLSSSGASSELSEKQFRTGMMIYGVILGIALLVYETIEVQNATSFAGMGKTLFSLLALLYLGFFLGYLFPGGNSSITDSASEETGRRAFTGMMLFHEEFELLARIVFYFSVGMSLGFMLFIANSSVRFSTSLWLQIVIISVIMPIAFIVSRYVSGLAGLPIAFFSRYSNESIRGDFGMVLSAMPKGITVAAVSVLILQSNIQFAAEIYIIALLSVIISSVCFAALSPLAARSSGVTAKTDKEPEGA